MFENLFSSSPAVWGGLFAAAISVPILIHLINLFRQQSIEWAAMEFLLQSYRRNRNWIRFKQVLLVLSRICVLLLALVLLAQVGCRDQRVQRLLGGMETHHYVILDDSYSMSDRSGGGTAFDRAKTVLSLISDRASGRQNQYFSLLRFSSNMADEEEPAGDAPISGNWIGRIVDSAFGEDIDNLKANLAVTDLRANAAGALTKVKQSIANQPRGNSIVYVLSDFRNTDWETSPRVAQLMNEISSEKTAIELVRCQREEELNLAITDLSVVGHVRVANVPLMMKATIRNGSSVPARAVQVKLQSLEFDGQRDKPSRKLQLPTLFIDRIEAGESVSREFACYFRTSGQHVVVAQLSDDCVQVDNHCGVTVQIKDATKVLVIKGESKSEHRYLELALNPNNLTGIQSEVRPYSFLRDCDPMELDEFDVAYLLDVPNFDPAAVRNLETFANAGGGVAFFVGPSTNPVAYNELLYASGNGLLPIPVGGPIEIPFANEGSISDLQLSRDPVFSQVSSANNSLLDLVQINTILPPAIDWSSQSNEVKVLASVRGKNEWPLLTVKPFGRGRVALFNSTIGPTWNNWARNATFPACMLILQDYLAAGNYEDAVKTAGAPIELEWSAGKYRRQVKLRRILSYPVSNSTIEDICEIELENDGSANSWSGVIDGNLVGDLSSLIVPGIYDLVLTKNDGKQELDRFSIRLDTQESELDLVNASQLKSTLKDSRPAIDDWDSFRSEPRRDASTETSRLLLFFLIAILLVEQWFSRLSSYR